METTTARTVLDDTISETKFQLRAVRNELKRIEMEREEALMAIKVLEEKLDELTKQKKRATRATAPKPQPAKQADAPKPAQAPKAAPAAAAAAAAAAAPVEEVVIPAGPGRVVCDRSTCPTKQQCIV